MIYRCRGDDLECERRGAFENVCKEGKISALLCPISFDDPIMSNSVRKFGIGTGIKIFSLIFSESKLELTKKTIVEIGILSRS